MLNWHLRKQTTFYLYNKKKDENWKIDSFSYKHNISKPLGVYNSGTECPIIYQFCMTKFRGKQLILHHIKD